MRKGYIFKQNTVISSQVRGVARRVTNRTGYRALWIAYKRKLLRCVDSRCLEPLILVHGGYNRGDHFRHYPRKAGTPPCRFRS